MKRKRPQLESSRCTVPITYVDCMADNSFWRLWTTYATFFVKRSP